MSGYQHYGEVEGSSACALASNQPEVIFVRVLSHCRTRKVRSNARIAYDALGIEDVVRGLKEGTAAGVCPVPSLGAAGVLYALGTFAIACLAALL